MSHNYRMMVSVFVVMVVNYPVVSVIPVLGV